jgi:hypothetical protein
MAQVKAIAAGMNQVGGGGLGHGMSSGGGMSGVMRESLVIMREIGRGNWARVPGSITLLLQYMGAFSKILKVTHSDLAKHALALEAEAQAMAKAAVAEAVRNGTSKLQVAAAEARLAAETAAAAGQVNASNLAIIAKQREAAAYAEAAAIEGAATTTALGPVGWLIAAIVALGAALYFAINHFKTLAQRQLNLADVMTGTNTATARQTNQMIEAAEAARKLALEIANLNKHEKTAAEISDEAVASLKRNATAKAALAKENKQIALDEIELAEKTHKISGMEATRQRAAVEVKAAKDEQAAKEQALKEEKARRDADFKDAESANAAADADYKKKAEANTAAGPEGQKKVNALAMAIKQEKALAEWKDALDKARRDENLATFHSPFDYKKDAQGNTVYAPSVKVGSEAMPKASEQEIAEKLRIAHIARMAIEAGLAPGQKATVEAQERAREAAQSKLRIKTEADKAAQELADEQKNAPAFLAAKTKDIRLKESATLYEQGQRGVTQGFGLNSQQKAGAYAATPPDFKRLVEAAIQTAQNTANLKPNGFNSVGNEPARFGPHK